MANEAARFLEAVEVDSALRAKLRALASLDPEEALRRMRALAGEAGMRFTPAELDAELARRAPELSEEQLGDVAGGLQQNIQMESRKFETIRAFLDGLSNT